MADDRQPSDAAMRLRALAHPLRWKLMDLVHSEGTATATRCAQVLGESVPSCGYHLGILGKYGYLEQVRDTPGRERPWRAIDIRQDLSPPGPGIDDELAAEAAIEAFLDVELDQIKDRRRRQAAEPPEWAAATAVGGSTMWVTAGELGELKDELLALLERYQDRSADPRLRPDGARASRVFFSTSVRPQP
jgi:Helix-turn-helix domain